MQIFWKDAMAWWQVFYSKTVNEKQKIYYCVILINILNDVLSSLFIVCDSELISGFNAVI